MKMRHFLLVSLALIVPYAYAQTQTVEDELGQTVVEVVTIDPVLGVPTTRTILTLEETATTATTALTDTLADPEDTLTATTTTPTTTTPTTTTTEQLGPVGQPGTTPTEIGAPTPFTYTTTLNGVQTAIVATFTPTNPETVLPAITGSGSIMDYDEWLSSYASQTGAAAGNSAPSLLSVANVKALWGVSLGILGGAWLVL